MALRILITHERFPPDFGGGGEYIALRTATGLLARGHDVRVLCPGDPAITTFEGVPTERLPIGRYAFNLYAPAIARRARAADIVYTFNFHACLASLVAARLVGKPVVCSILALFGPAWRSMKGRRLGIAYQAWERFVVTRRFDRTLYLSAASMRDALRLGAPAATSEVVSPGIDHASLPARDPEGAPLVLFAGRLDVRKGIHHVLAVARALPDIPFAAVGWAPDIAALRAAAPPNLTIIESHGPEPYLPLLARARVFLFPSYSETYGIVIAEAMACGAAVVSSIDTSDYEGALVRPGDEAAMIAAVRRLWDDPAAAAAAGAENLRQAATFTWDRHIDRLEALFAEVIAERAGRRAT
jgi:glycosyltransferase involved in cell wall biosynthesis